MEKAKVQAEFDQISLQAMNLEAVLLAYESEIIDYDIQIAASKTDSSKEDVDRLTKEYEEHYLQALDIMRIRDDDAGMPFDPALLAPSSSPLGRFGVGRRRGGGVRGSSPMSGIGIIRTN